MGCSCAHDVHGPGVSSLVTVSLAVDFIGSAEVGQWLAIETDVIKTGRTICFAQSLIKADDVRDRAGQRRRSRGAEEGAGGAGCAIPDRAQRCGPGPGISLAEIASPAVSVTRSMKARTLADNSREVG